MTDNAVTSIGVQSILLAAKLCAPTLATALAIGLFIGLIQSATQIQEQTLAFVPKLAGVAIVLVITGNWMLSELISFTHSLFNMIPQLVGT